MSPTVVLISGANRGLGRGLLELYLARADHVVIAAIRNLQYEICKELVDLSKGSGTRLIIVRMDASSDVDGPTAVRELQEQGINHLDIVIANAGVMFAASKVSEIKISDLNGHMIPNCYGVIRLFQAMLPLLLRSESPKWVTIGGAAASIGVSSFLVNYCTRAETQYPVPNAAYGPSKISAHWLTKKMDAEEERLAAFVVHPGWIQTKMGIDGARLYGLGDVTPPVTIADSASGVISIIDKASKESHGGRFWDYGGSELAW